jgi:hypothetical protein
MSTTLNIQNLNSNYGCNPKLNFEQNPIETTLIKSEVSNTTNADGSSSPILGRVTEAAAGPLLVSPQMYASPEALSPAELDEFAEVLASLRPQPPASASSSSSEDSDSSCSVSRTPIRAISFDSPSSSSPNKRKALPIEDSVFRPLELDFDDAVDVDFNKENESEVNSSAAAASPTKKPKHVSPLKQKRPINATVQAVGSTPAKVANFKAKEKVKTLDTLNQKKEEEAKNKKADISNLSAAGKSTAPAGAAAAVATPFTLKRVKKVEVETRKAAACSVTSLLTNQTTPQARELAKFRAFLKPFQLAAKTFMESLLAPIRIEGMTSDNKMLYIGHEKFKIDKLNIGGNCQFIFRFTEDKEITIANVTVHVRDLIIKVASPLETPGKDVALGRDTAVACLLLGNHLGMPIPKPYIVGDKGKIWIFHKVPHTVSCAAWKNAADIDNVLNQKPQSKKLFGFAKNWLTVAAQQGRIHNRELIADFYPRNVMLEKDGTYTFVDPSCPGAEDDEWEGNLNGFLIAWSNGSLSAFNSLIADFPDSVKAKMYKYLAEEMKDNGGVFPVSSSSI